MMVLRSVYVLPPSEKTGLSYLGRTRTAPVVCYLDFDGVLHHDAVFKSRRRGIYLDIKAAPERMLFEWAGHLEQALEPYPDVKLVLSTSWVRVLGFSKARSLLPVSLAQRVIGATFHSQAHGQARDYLKEFEAMPRGEQVWSDVTRRMPKRWFAIDDAVDEWADELLPYLVPCAGASGLSSEATRAALAYTLANVHQSDVE